MDIRDDGLAILPPHVIFIPSKFQTSAEWHDQEAAAKWHKGVVVSLQPNAWVDAKTHMHGLKKVLGPMNELLGSESSNVKELVIEDNLSSKTELVYDFWEDELPNIEPPVFVPPNMTSYLQVVDSVQGLP